MSWPVPGKYPMNVLEGIKGFLPFIFLRCIEEIVENSKLFRTPIFYLSPSVLYFYILFSDSFIYTSPLLTYSLVRLLCSLPFVSPSLSILAFTLFPVPYSQFLITIFPYYTALLLSFPSLACFPHFSIQHKQSSLH